MKVTQAIVAQPNVVAVMPTLDHGDTDDIPRPVPNNTSTNETAAAPAAPAKIAAHETPLTAVAMGLVAACGPMDTGSGGRVCGWFAMAAPSKVSTDHEAQVQWAA